MLKKIKGAIEKNVDDIIPETLLAPSNNLLYDKVQKIKAIRFLRFFEIKNE